MLNREKIVVLLMRIGLGFGFLYAAISSFINPTSWVGFFPGFLIDVFSENFVLIAFGVYEVLLGVWLFSGKKLFYASALSALTFAGIVLFNFGAMDIVFRDVSLFFMVLALMMLSKK